MQLFVSPHPMRVVSSWLFFLVSLCSWFQAQADVTTGLVAYYPFNGNANDASGNGNDGTVHGATLTANRFGNANSAFKFNGNGNSIELPNAALNGLNDVSFVAWFKLDDNGASTLLSGANQFQDNEITIYLMSGNTEIIIKGTSLVKITFNTTEWYQIILVRNGTTGEFSLYINGIIISTGNLPSGNFAIDGLIIGRDQDCVLGCFDVSQDFNGIIDDIRIYNRALSAADIQELYQEGLLTIIKQGTGSGTVTSDPAGINCGSDCSENYDSGTTVTLTATPAAGSIFAGWSGACNGTATTCAVSVDANSVATATFNITPKPDFTITVMTIAPAAPIANGTVIVSVTVKNQGAVAANGGTLRVWANQPAAQVCAASGGNINVPIGTIAAGASKPFTNLSIPAGPGGIKTLRAFVDAACTVVESNETNNQRTLSYRVTNRLLADFVVTEITLSPTTPAVNSTFAASITVKNQGTVASLGGYLDVWINSPTTQGCGAVGNFWVDVGSVAAGASKAIAINGIPAGAAGAKTLRAYVDSWCEIAELNEGNNQLTKAYTVQ